MKRLYTILSLTICTLSVYAQNNVFVLVDVSKSGAKTLKEKDAKNITEDIVSASFSLNTYHSWKLIDDLNTISDPNLKLIFTGSGSPFPLASNNSVVGLVEIGNYGRNLSNKVFSRLSPSQDFRTFMSVNYPNNVCKDNCTLIDLPLAWLASYLKSIPLSEYYVFIISDNQQDTKCQKSLTNNDYKLIADYGKGTNQLRKIATLQGNSGSEIMFITIWKINLANIPIAPNTGTGIIIPPAIVDTTSSNAEIKITSPPEAKKNKEHELNTESLKINWNCPNCPQGIKYTVMVSEYDGGKFRETKKNLVAITATFKVPDGKFKITVSASNYSAATSDYTFVSVSTGGYGWLISLLLLAIIVGVIIKVSNDRRKKNSKKGGTEKASDIFSSGSSISQQGSNTKHY